MISYRRVFLGNSTSIEANDEKFRTLIKKKREEIGLSITKLSELTKISKSYLSNIEKGNRGLPSPEIIKKLSVHLDIDFYKLMDLAGYSTEITIEKLFDVKKNYEMHTEILNFVVKKYLITVQNLSGEDKVDDDIKEIIENDQFTPSNIDKNIFASYKNLISSKIIDNMSIQQQNILLRLLWLRKEYLKNKNQMFTEFDLKNIEFPTDKKDAQYVQIPGRVNRINNNKKIISIPIIKNFTTFFSAVDTNSIKDINYEFRVEDVDADDNTKQYFIFIVQRDYYLEDFNIKQGYKILFEKVDYFSTNGLYLVYLKMEKTHYISKIYEQPNNSYICVLGNSELSPIVVNKNNLGILGKAIKIEYDI
jgi:transcriptional regulator with XRE-family HTH domain